MMERRAKCRATTLCTGIGRMVAVHASTLWFIKYFYVFYLILLIQKPYGRHLY